MALISFYGGKNFQSSWIFSQITQQIKENTDTFIEVFSGSFSLYLNEDFSFAKNIIYNDMNSYLTNFMCCCNNDEFIKLLEEQYKPGKLLYFDENMSKNPTEVYDYNYNKFKEIFYKFRKELYHDTEGKEIKINIPDFDLALKYGILLRHAFSGISGKKIGYSYSPSSYVEGKKQPIPKSQLLLKSIKDKNLQDKLSKISSFEVLDFEKLVNKYDSEKTLFYCDPPYYLQEKNYFRGDEHFGKAGHERLSNVLKSMKGKFILSYYDFEGLDKMYPKDKYHWIEKSFNKASTSNVKISQDKKGYEILIMNFNPNEKPDEKVADNFWD